MRVGKNPHHTYSAKRRVAAAASALAACLFCAAAFAGTALAGPSARILPPSVRVLPSSGLALPPSALALPSSGPELSSSVRRLSPSGPILASAGPAKTSEIGEEETLTESYNRTLGLYEEQFESGRQFLANLPNGGQMADAAWFQFPEGTNVRMERDGNEFSCRSGELIYGAGHYTALITVSNMDGTLSTATFSFRLLGAPAGAADTGEYDRPKVPCGVKILQEEDLYRCQLPNYKCFFTDLASEGAAAGSARFEFPDNIAYVLVKDGQPVSVLENKPVTAPGSYLLRVVAPSYGTEYGLGVIYQADFPFTITPPETDGLSDSSLGGSGGEIGTGGPEELDEVFGEQYFDQMNLYEESFSNGTVFYSNVANADAVSGNVYLDVPDNISVSMTVDGRAADFANKTYYQEEGSYLLTMTTAGKENGELKKYRGTFRFRIQKNLPRPASTDFTGPAAGSADGAGGDGMYGLGEEPEWGNSPEGETLNGEFPGEDGSGEGGLYGIEWKEDSGTGLAAQGTADGAGGNPGPDAEGEAQAISEEEAQAVSGTDDAKAAKKPLTAANVIAVLALLAAAGGLLAFYLKNKDKFKVR